MNSGKDVLAQILQFVNKYESEKLVNRYYLIIAQAKHTLKSALSVYEIMQTLGISVFNETPVKELLI